MAQSNYFCCGVPTNPFDDIFGSGATQPVAQDQVKPDWGNPFGLANPQQQPLMDARSVDTSGTGGRSSGGGGETRSIGSVSRTSHSQHRHTARVSNKSHASNLAHKSLKDISREEKARKRALFLSETLMVSEENSKETQKKKAVGLGGNAMTATHAQMILEKNRSGDAGPGVDDRALVAQAANRLAVKIKQQIDKTETTRPKKEPTPEDIRDPETVRGMVCRAGIAMEEDARKKARSMISDGKYPFHEKAGKAIWSIQDTRRSRKTDGTLNPLV